MPMSDAALSVLTEKDVPGLSALCRHAGWPGYDERELGLLLQNGRLFGYKDSEGTLLSCSGIFPYGSFASLGLVIVQKEFRGAGLGKKMVEACIGELNDTIPIMLVATEQGLPLYQKAGFQQISSIYKYVCDGFLPHTADSDIDIAPFQTKDFQALTKTDRAAFGTGREHLLQQLVFRLFRMYRRQKQGWQNCRLWTFPPDAGQLENRAVNRAFQRMCGSVNQ
ncbi:GNAT family N-acetyltransferase [Bacillus sp. HU-1818]|uniref:GNAT family N-acetyltransferase n=1 Tax=Bacillus sp. HU-1818 TaxID=2704469 RepID=UPI001F5C47A1|nr:GNAT family N-acetyltransferase [Bacillus sp. HU-1818]